MDTSRLSLTELRERVAGGEVAPDVPATEAIARARKLNERSRVFVELREDSPDEATTEGALAGVPIALKDLFGDSGRAPTAGSLVTADWCTDTAEVVRRLRGAGAAIVGYSNLHEWAIGTTSAVTAWGPIANPRDESLISGGSSGGSAAALAAGVVPAAIGTDAGGSIRIPSACCGVVGLKPTWGAVPTDGYCEGEVAIDHIGPMARSVEDVKVLFEVIAAVRVPQLDVSGLRVGIAREHFFADVDDRVERAVEEAVALLVRDTASVEDVEVAGVGEAAGAIASSLLPHNARLLAGALESRRNEFRPETLAFLDMGAAMTDEDIREGAEMRARVRAGWDAAFRQVDVIVTPTIGGLPPPIQYPMVELPSGRQICEGPFLALNAPMNAGGVPSLSLPCGMVGDLSVNLSLTAARGREDVVLAVGRALERALDERFVNRITP